MVCRLKCIVVTKVCPFLPYNKLCYLCISSFSFEKKGTLWILSTCTVEKNSGRGVSPRHKKGVDANKQTA